MMKSSTLVTPLLLTALFAAPLAAQTPVAPRDSVLTGPHAAAVDTVRRLYDRGQYAAAVEAAERAMRSGAGSTELQAWRLASLAQQPGTGVAPMRTARRMAWMHPTSPWAWIGLAMTASMVPDSGAVAREAADKALTLAPTDSVVKRMAERAKQQAR